MITGVQTTIQLHEDIVRPVMDTFHTALDTSSSNDENNGNGYLNYLV